MKLVLLVALATVAAAASVFKPGEEYVYHYKGHVLSGIPKASKQFAGILIDTLVVFQFQQDYKVVMKLDKIKLFKINNHISTPPSEPLNENEITLLTGEQAVVLTEFLVKPIKFRYVDGTIQELEKETPDRYWSVNIKKGILSLFQVTLKDRTPTTDYSSFDSTGSRPRYPYTSRSSNPTPFWKSSKNAVYTVMETDVTGTCETKYTLISDKTHLSPSSSEMYVTSVRDFNSCQNQPFYIQGLFQGVYNHQEEEDLLQPMVETSYVITGDLSHFLIKEAKLRGKYSFMVHGLDGGSMSSYILQTLKLKTTQSITRVIRLTNSLTEKHGLLMVIPKASQIPEKKGYEETPSSSSQSGWMRRPTYQSRSTVESWSDEDESTTEDITSIIPVIEEKLSKLIECVYSPTETKCSETLYQISRILRELPRPVLKTIVTKYVSMSHSHTEYRKSEVLLDLLPTLMSPASSKVLMDLIRERLVSELRGSLMINAMTLVAKPTPSVVNSLLTLFKEMPKEHSTKLGSKTLLRQSLLLGVGTMTHRMINVMRSHGKPVPEILTFIETVSSELKKMLSETSSKTEKVLIIESMGNMGASQTISTLKSLVEDSSETLPIRIQAIFSLRRLAKQFRKQVVPILLSIYMDIKELPELRQAAFVVIIHSNPGFTTLQMIGHRLRHEPSSQVRTLVYSNLVNLAMFTSHEPEHKELKQNAKLVVKTIPPVKIGIYDSFTMKLSQFSDDYDMGASLQLSKIKSKVSGLPIALNAKLQGTYLGKHRHILESGVVGTSVEKVLRKTLGPYGMLSEFLKGKVTLEDFIRPFTNFEWNNIEYKVKELLSKTLVDMTNDEKPHAYWYLYLLDSKIQHILLNSDNVEEIVNKVKIIVPEIISKLTQGLKVDVIKAMSISNSLTIASPIGIPLTVNSSLTAVGKVDGIVKVNNLPTFSEVFRRGPVSLPKISLDVDLKPTFDIVHYLSVGCNMRWLTSGVFLESIVDSNLPTKFSVHFKGPEHEITIKKFMPKKPVVLVHAKVSPHTFLTYLPTAVHRLPYTYEAKEILNVKIVKVTPFEHKYRCTITGMELETRGVFSVCGPQWCPTMPLFGKQSITITATPLSNVDYIHLKIKSLRSNIELEGLPASTPTEELYGEDSDEDTETDSYPYSETISPRHYRRSSSRMISSGEFQPITVDPIFNTEPIKRQILVTVGPNTQQSPKIKGLFTWLMGRRYLKNQFNAQVVRLAHGETPAWKLHLNTVVNPLAVTSMLPIPTHMYSSSEPTAEYLTKTHFSWIYGGLENEIRVRVLPGSPIDFSKELKEHKIFTAFNLPEAKLQKYKFTIETDVTHMNKRALKVVSVLHDALKYQMYDYLTTSVPSNPINNKIIVAIELLPWWEQMNIIVKTPIQNSYIANVPFYLNPLFPTDERIRLHDVPSWVWYKNYTFEETPEYSPYETREEEQDEDDEEQYDSVPYKNSPVVGGECTINGEEMVIMSFDGVSRPFTSLRKYQTKGCKTLISKDCHNERLFSVISTLKPVTSESTWKTKVVIPNYEIEVEGKNGRLFVSINGEEKTIHPSEPLVISEDYSETSPKLFKIEKFDSKHMEIKFYELGAKIIVDTERKVMKIKLAPWSTLQGELCGICGNFNLDQSDDYTPQETLDLPGGRTYFENNLLPTESCDVERIYNTDDEYCTKEEHLTIHRYENGIPMTCRTEKKVVQCAPGCRPVKLESVKTCFTCTSETGMSLPRNTYYTPRWEDESGVECSDFYHRVEVPTRCVPVY
jgi:hypothetical protein